MLNSQNIQVFVRCRPPTPNERRSVLEVLPDRNEVRALDRSKGPDGTRNFIFDQVFCPDSKQSDVYQSVVKPLIDQVLQGYNCTVFAYGQTGTGKTYTMEGYRSEGDFSWEDDPQSGIIPRAISQLFDTLKEHDNEFTVRVSFLEIHNEDTYDLLSSISDTTRLKIFDDAQKKGSVIVGGLEEIIVQSKAEIYDILRKGSAKRQTAATLLNACSSRSHTVFSVTVHIKEGSMDEDELLKIGKLNLVDLAGSENIGRSGAQDKRAREAGNINQSLLTLGRVITALVERRPHVPYRESKLTRLLQDSLGGKTKTSIIATISPGALDLEDTLSTLDYASRAKKITNKPEANQRLTKKAFLREYAQEIERLRRDLQATREKNGVFIDKENYDEMCKKLSANNSAINEKEERMDALQRELEKSKKLFDEFHLQYEQTKEELEKSRIQCERQKRLIKAQKQTREKLTKQAEQILHVAETVTTDNNLLHGKKDRIETILKENTEIIDKHRPEVSEDIARYQSLIEMYTKELNCLGTEFYKKIQTGIASNATFINEINHTNQQMANQLLDQARILRESIEGLKDQSKTFQDQAHHYDTLANSCRSQTNKLQDEINNRLKIAKDLDDRANLLSDGQSISKSVKDTMTVIDYGAQETSKKLEQATITLDFTMKRELRTLNQKLDILFTRLLKSDSKTGNTPLKKIYDIPRHLINADTSLNNISITEDCEEDNV